MFEARLVEDSATKHFRGGSCFLGCSSKQQVVIEVTSVREYMTPSLMHGKCTARGLCHVNGPRHETQQMHRRYIRSSSIVHSPQGTASVFWCETASDVGLPYIGSNPF